MFPATVITRIDPHNGKDGGQIFFDALNALECAGFIYEAVVLLNRNPILSKSKDGSPYGAIPDDAEILCDLGSPSPFGPVSDIERGLSEEQISTVMHLAKQKGYADSSSYFQALCGDDRCDFLAVVSMGQPAMIAGLYRLRFRVTHSKNAFVAEAARRHLNTNHSFLNRLNYLRAMKDIEPIARTLQSCSIPLQ
jgi:hypothetical protein